MKKIYILLLISTCSFYFSSAQNTWKQESNFGGTVRVLAACFSIGNYGYIGTGSDGVNRTDFWQYDPSSDTWTQKADFGGVARQRATGFSVGNYGYICNGCVYPGIGYYSDMWQYDPAANQWNQKASFPGAARQQSVGFGIGNYGYVGTGYDGNIFYADFYQYNPSNDTWTQEANFGGPARAAAVGFELGGYGYIGTGYDDTCFADFWQYNPTANTWTQKANYGGGQITNAVGFAIGCYGYIGTGDDENQTRYDDFWQYDTTANQWTQMTNFPGGARQYAVAFSISGYGYLGTGYTPAFVNDFWQYTPNTCAASVIASFQSSNTILCTNSCVNFTDQSTNATSWQWSFPGAIPDTSTDENPSLVCYTTAGNYSVTLIASNSTGSDTLTFSNYINVNPSPPTPVITQLYDTLYCSTDSSYASYQWFLDTMLIPGATDTFLVVSQSGNYNVQVTNKYGCKIATGINFILGIQNYINDNQITLYPNPADNQLTIQSTSFQNEAVTISVINVLGQILQQEKLKWSSDLSININNLSAGMYFLQMKTEKENVVKKFVKE